MGVPSIDLLGARGDEGNIRMIRDVEKLFAAQKVF
jgi:hypothetical protein